MRVSLTTTGHVICVALALATSRATAADPVNQPRLRAASLRFAVTPAVGSPTYGRTGTVVEEVAGPLKTTVTLLEDGPVRLCLVMTDFHVNALNLSGFLRHTVAKELALPVTHVLIFSSHGHSIARVARNEIAAYVSYEKKADESPELDFLPVGRELVDSLRSHIRRLPNMLDPVSVWWAAGREDRITYNRKGRQADGSTYFMREEDRVLVGKDFRGDIDKQAPVVVLKNAAGRAVGGLVQFTGHPVTSYHPEKLVIFGEWPQVACDMVSEHLSPSEPPAVGFLQGCAGDVNSKEMFRGGVERAQYFGRLLGASYIKALEDLRPSRRDGLNYEVRNVKMPLAPLPSKKTLLSEIAEMADFIRRADAGDEDTLACVGLNFPRGLTPAYRGALVKLILPWNRWALNLHETGRADTVMKHLEIPVYVLRLGDVGIVGMPCEPFQGIGRQIRRGSPFPLVIPCGYTNGSHAYITDAPNTGDREYMSAFYRYTRFRPAFAKPAGDVLAEEAVRVLERFAK